MIADKYVALPDGMEPEDVQKAFDQLFAEIDENPDVDVLDAANAIYELADRQWHSYSILPDYYKQRLETWITKHWLPPSLQFITAIGFAMGSIGLPEVLSLYRKEAETSTLPPDVRTEIQEYIDQIAPHIDDPYYGMPR